MITTISTSGIQRDLLLTTSLILVDKNDSVKILVNGGQDDFFYLQFNFSDTGHDFQTSSTYNKDRRIYDIVLHKWDGKEFIETQYPWEFTNANKKYWAQWRTKSNEKGARRVFEITIWTLKLSNE